MKWNMLTYVAAALLLPIAGIRASKVSVINNLNHTIYVKVQGAGLCVKPAFFELKPDQTFSSDWGLCGIDSIVWSDVPMLQKIWSGRVTSSLDLVDSVDFEAVKKLPPDVRPVVLIPNVHFKAIHDPNPSRTYDIRLGEPEDIRLGKRENIEAYFDASLKPAYPERIPPVSYNLVIKTKNPPVWGGLGIPPTYFEQIAEGSFGKDPFAGAVDMTKTHVK